MVKKLSVSVEYPEIDFNNKDEVREYIKTLSDDLAEQIYTHLLDERREQDKIYWEQRIKNWEMETRFYELTKVSNAIKSNHRQQK